MQKRLQIKTMVYTLVFTCIAMGIMIYYAATKAIVITEVAPDEMEYTSDDETSYGVEELHFRTDQKEETYLCIPLLEDIKAEQVSMENHYMDQELWISIKGLHQGFYEKESVIGDRTKVMAGTYEYKEEYTLLKFRFTEVYEYKSTLADNMLYVEPVSPSELYEKIVVIDAGGRGGREKGTEDSKEQEITLDIVKRLKQKLDNTDIKAYYTRLDNQMPEEENKVMITNATKADMLISIYVNSDDEEQYGVETTYNAVYFIPEFGSVELADLLEREVVTAVSGKARGLVAAGQKDYVIQNMTIPAAAVGVGYMTHPKEGKLLQQETYREKIAEGLYCAIIKAYEGMNREGE